VLPSTTAADCPPPPFATPGSQATRRPAHPTAPCSPPNSSKWLADRDWEQGVAIGLRPGPPAGFSCVLAPGSSQLQWPVSPPAAEQQSSSSSSTHPQHHPGRAAGCGLAGWQAVKLRGLLAAGRLAAPPTAPRHGCAESERQGGFCQAWPGTKTCLTCTPFQASSRVFACVADPISVNCCGFLSPSKAWLVCPSRSFSDPPPPFGLALAALADPSQSQSLTGFFTRRQPCLPLLARTNCLSVYLSVCLLPGQMLARCCS